MTSSGWKACLVHQQAVAALRNRNATLDAVRLPLLVERHHDHGRTQTPDLARLVQEFFIAVLEADRIGHALALQALQSRCQHFPAGRVDHDRHAGDVRFGGQQVD